MIILSTSLTPISFFFFSCPTNFLFYYYYYFTLKYFIVFSIHQHASAMGIHIFPSWTPVPPPSPYHPSGSSQCTSPKLPVSCIEPGPISLNVCVCVCVCVLAAQSCLTLCYTMDCSLPDSTVHGILQARILEWVAIPFSRESFQPRDQTCVSCITGRCFTIWATR